MIIVASFNSFSISSRDIILRNPQKSYLATAIAGILSCGGNFNLSLRSDYGKRFPAWNWKRFACESQPIVSSQYGSCFKINFSRMEIGKLPPVTPQMNTAWRISFGRSKQSFLTGLFLRLNGNSGRWSGNVSNTAAVIIPFREAQTVFTGFANRPFILRFAICNL